MQWPSILYLLSKSAIAICTWALIAAFLLITTQIALSDSHNPPHNDLPHSSTHGAVASENKLCSRIGTDILEKRGGNAADAMIATVFCVGVIGMYHSGIGGGGFMLVRSKEGKYESIDFREAAPMAADEDMYKYNVNGSMFSGLASGVPGELRGLEYLHTNYGSLPWRDLLQPAIALARDGFAVSHDLVRYMDFVPLFTDDFLTRDPIWALDFAPNGTRVGLGDILTRKRYAATLSTIADQGASALYSGPLADDLVRAVQEANGTMTLADLAAYRAIARPAMSISYRNFTLYGCPAPSSGSIVLSALKTIEGYPDMGAPSAANLSTHRLDEAIRFAYAERSLLGDPDFVSNSSAYEASILTAAAAAGRRDKISDGHTLNVSDYDPLGFEVSPSHGTSHVVAADSSGLAITLTTTVNLIFGSQLMVSSSGIILNDEMNDFSVPHRRNAFGYAPSPANYIRPGKRPLSSMTPTIAEHAGNGSLYYVVGAAGGSRIVSATVQNLWNVLDKGMRAGEGLAQARFHDQLIPNTIQFEWGADGANSSSASGFPAPLHPGPGPDDPDSLLATELPASGRDGAPAARRAESGIGTGRVRGFDNGTVAFMEGREHVVAWVPPGYSSAQALRWDANGTWEAAAEPRQRDSGGFVV